MNNESRFVPRVENNPRRLIPKQELIHKYMEARQELQTLRRTYENNVYREIESLKTRYTEAKNSLFPCYGKLKRMIKEATTDDVLIRCKVPYHKHNIQDRRETEKAAYHYNEALRSPKHESARNNNGRNKTGIFKELCSKFRDVQPRRQWKDVDGMRKADIEEEYLSLKDHIRGYDYKFLQAESALRELRQNYSESKRLVPHLRYPRMKRMIQTVIENKKLKPN